MNRTITAVLLAAAAAAAVATALHAKDAPKPAALLPANQPPELETPPYTRVAPGKAISFGLNVIDQDADAVRVDVVAKPASASYDPVTLTMTWKPTAKEAVGTFVVKLTETQRGSGTQRVFLHTFGIAVDKKAKDAPAPPPASAVVEQVITIHDAERLAQANKDWPITKVLDVVAAIELDKLAEADRAGVDGSTGARLYQDALVAIATTHANPRANPTAPEFDKQAFDAKAWKLVAVRPRVDKKVEELRLVYEDLKAPEPIYLMFRFRLTREADPVPADVAAANNKAFTTLVSDAFFTDGQPNPKHTTDKKAHGKAVSAFIGKVLAYDQDGLKTEFSALPHEARFGGGAARDEQGAYASGDGWAWAVLKTKWLDVDGKKTLRMVSIPIPGFATDLGPNDDGTAWRAKCAPAFDPDDKAHKPGWDALCRKKLGFVDLPQATQDGGVTSGAIDATNLFVDYKLGSLVERVALRDPRRDFVEENGMTCSQCHVRDFGNGDPRDLPYLSPKNAGTPIEARRLPTTFFNLVPEETWRPFMLAFHEFQECRFKERFDKFGLASTGLTCPLKAE